VPTITFVFGVLLIIVGLWGRFSTATASPTALIPAYLGAAFVVLGLLAHKERWLKHAMHAAALLGLLGFLGAGYMAFPHLPALLSGTPIKRPNGSDATFAVRMQTIMALLCGVFVGLCINSFVSARRRRARAREAVAGP
jgi:hypothetical protein